MKKFLKWGSITIVAVFVIAIIAAAVFEDKIEDKIIKELNKTLNSEMRVKAFDLSMLSDFPSASARFMNVELEDNFGGILLETKRLSFQLGLFSIFTSNIKVKSLKIEDGAFSIRIDKKGRVNYNIFKSTGKEEAPSDIAISFDKAIMKDVELIYEDESEEQSVSFLIEDAEFSGNFSAKKFSLLSFAKIKSRFIDIGKTRLLEGKDIGYEAEIHVDLEDGVYDLDMVNIAVEANAFNVDGTVISKKSFTNYDLVIKGEEGNIDDLIKLLPRDYLEYVKDFTGKGDFHFNAIIKGKDDRTHDPAILAKAVFKNGKIRSNKFEKPVKDLSFTAVYSNGKGEKSRHSFLKIKDIKGYFNKELFESNLTITNLDDPDILFSLDGTIPMSSIYGFAQSASITAGEGEIEINNFILDGKYKDLTSPNAISKVKTSGTIEFDDAGLTINDERMRFDRGKLIFNNNLLNIKELKLEGGGSEMIFSGKVNNLFPVLFSDSLNTKDAELKFKVDLDSREIDFGKLLNLSDIAVEKGDVKDELYDSLKIENTQKIEHFTKFLKGEFNVNIDEFKFNKIEGEKFKGKFEFDNNELTINGETSAMAGYFTINGKMFFDEEPDLKVKIECDEIDITDFFDQAENFGQNVLKSEHVSGTLSSRMVIRAFWDAEGNFMEDKLKALVAVSVEDGELKDFELLTDFSSVVKLKALEHIRFENMENWMEIRKRKIYLPAMFIRNNAMNLSISGEHTFDNNIKYFIKINAAQVLTNMFKEHNSDLKPLEDKRKGWFNLFFKIYGDVDNFNHKTARKEAKKEFIKGKHRKNEIKAALFKEFGEFQLIEKSSGETSNSNKIHAEDDGDEYLEGF